MCVRDFLRFGLHEVVLLFDDAAFGSSETGYESLCEDEAADGGGEYYWMREGPAIHH